MIHVTDKAAEQIRKIMEKEGLLGHGLRVAVVGGGCSGMSYKLNFEKDPAQGDKVYEEKGVRIIVDSKSTLFLNGTTLDFSDGLSGTGFSFVNPNAKSTCGCGTSFSG
ncbi:MAG TPA: iron-sulfur cluster assembly accessory protein [Candidatus Polarisedimenticolia bacterium]|jgi:iron-sulfur cluster assembly accessory protein|nr:iron-sulfur cluster assembly accessory protein [Candidatus Polarisedimenticolia bacterium]